MLTPKDIEQKEFARAVRGYKDSEVDEFLNFIMVDMGSLIEENKKLKADLEVARSQLSNYDKAGNSLAGTLEAAQSLVKDMTVSSKEKADAIVSNATFKADEIERQAKTRLARLEIQITDLKSQITYFRERYHDLIQGELSQLDRKFAGLEDDIDRETRALLRESQVAKESQEDASLYAEDGSGTATLSLEDLFRDEGKKNNNSKKMDKGKTIVY